MLITMPGIMSGTLSAIMSGIMSMSMSGKLSAIKSGKLSFVVFHIISIKTLKKPHKTKMIKLNTKNYVKNNVSQGIDWENISYNISFFDRGNVWNNTSFNVRDNVWDNVWNNILRDLLNHTKLK